VNGIGEPWRSFAKRVSGLLHWEHKERTAEAGGDTVAPGPFVV
jgi:hypothetical protein